jgi:Ca2+-binding RTX toxin-like protein
MDADGGVRAMVDLKEGSWLLTIMIDGPDLPGLHVADLRAGRVPSEIFGDADDNLLRGKMRADAIFAGEGDDLVFGRRGGDLLSGQGGDDDLRGGGGGDVLDGGWGRDKLTGGHGADHFLFEYGDGRDVVRDFTLGLDKLDLHSVGHDFDDLTIIDKAMGARVSYGPGDVIILRGVDADDLTADDFIL